MKLYYKEYLNSRSAATVKGPYCRYYGNAVTTPFMGEEYVCRHPNYTHEIREIDVTIFQWIVGKP